ncbi:MAG: TolC family protein [Planctomycetes bacterium]|nr:TolC family protein [Planctomycetota bacterium]
MTAPWKTIYLASILCCGCHTAADRTFVRRESAPPGSSKLAASRIDESPDPVEPSSNLVRQVSDEQPAGPVNPPPASDLSLASCVALGLSQNPDLIAARQAENVSTAALGVAETYPFNPFVQVQATPYQESPNHGFGTTYHYVLLMQTIQLAHQQQFREEGASATLNSTRWAIHQQELLNVAQTERLYFTTLYLRGLWDLAKTSHENNQQLLRILEKQLEAGQATAADVALVRVDARSTHQQVRLARANFETALRDLKRQLGMNADDSALIAGDLRTLAWRNPTGVPLKSDDLEIPIESFSSSDQEKLLVASRAASRPDVLAARADVDTARANLCLASASKTPDLQIGPYYQRTLDGTTYLGFRAQMDLPVINSGRPLEQQRAAELAQRVTVWQQAIRRAELEAQAAWERYKLAHAMLAEESAVTAADLPRELQSLEEQFLAGEIDPVRVMQARASIIQNQRVRLDLLNELAQSAANLTGTTGMPIEELLQ